MSDILEFKMYERVGTGFTSYDKLCNNDKYASYRTYMNHIKLDFQKRDDYEFLISILDKTRYGDYYSYHQKISNSKNNFYLSFYNFILNQLIENEDNLVFKIKIDGCNQIVFEEIKEKFSEDGVIFKNHYIEYEYEKKGWFSTYTEVQTKIDYYEVDFTNYKYFKDLYYEVKYIKSNMEIEQQKYEIEQQKYDDFNTAY
jgi:hypothetical protein